MPPKPHIGSRSVSGRTRSALLSAFAIAALLASTASLLLALSVARDYRGVTLRNVRNDFAKPGVILAWPTTQPVPSAWPAPTQVQEDRAFALTYINAWASTESATTHQIAIKSFGWPLPVLQRIQMWWPREDPRFATTTPSDSGLEVMWLNLVVQSAGFGAICVGLIVVAPWLMSRRGLARARRGQCVACGHPLAGLPRCPECGSEARPDGSVASA